MASLARSLGKNIEPRLLKEWGGWPSTTLLRHRDATLDRHTKARYHAALEKLCPDLSFPTTEEESREPVQADSAYRSATKRLIEARRGPSFKILHAENASYGFRRNLLGLKPVALGIAIGLAALTGIVWLLEVHATQLTFFALSVFRDWQTPLVLIAFDLVCAAVWLLAVRESFVLQAAREYGEALLRSLDSPEG